MNHKIPFQIAGECFNSYAQLEKKIETILTRYKDQETIKHKDFSFILDFLKSHPHSLSSEVDKVDRIKSIIIKRNSKEKKLSFYVVNDDGQIIYLNYRKYFKEINRLEQQRVNHQSKGFKNLPHQFILYFFAFLFLLIFIIIPNLIKRSNLFLVNIKSFFLQSFLKIKQKDIEMKSKIPHFQRLGQNILLAKERYLEEQNIESDKIKKTTREKHGKKIK
ncbi:unnamed protein product [Paramecium sonneborni]|uniref:Uncharacterized protein n=1 Tax=Paramecium sonneborni TaxID=65129 RepID=A0A8S1RU81_9CILI|nr:unnamed protein product [Paramecium sonneborni]